MQKTTKGALAAGAAALLLAGGAGTYAAWQAAGEDTAGAKVTTGHLGVSQIPGTSSWTWQTPGRTGEVFNPTDDTLVPGDSIRFTGQYKLSITGNNISARLIADSGTSADLPAGMSWTPDADNDLTGLDEGDDQTVVTVGGTLTFDGTATGGMDQTVTVDDLGVTVEQVLPAGP